MTESTLSVSYDDLKQAIAEYLGYGIDSTVWTTAQTNKIDLVIKRGLRKFYKPQQVFKGEPPHRWSFLNPTTSITTIASYTTGTIAITNGATTVTLTDGVFPSWTATNGTLVVDGTSYAIASRTDDTHLELSSAWDEDTETAADYALWHNGNYDLPDNFAGVASRTLSHAEGIYKPNVKLKSEAAIRSLRANDSTSRSYPRFFAVRPKNTTVSSTEGQRFEMLFYPAPDDAYALYYEMVYQIDMISDTYAYPLGGAAHGETILAACLAVAELITIEKAGPMENDYISKLGSSIREDQVAYQPEFFGYNGDNSDEVNETEDVRRHGLATFEPLE